MSEEAVKRYEETKSKGPAELRKQENPPIQEPIYDTTRGNNNADMAIPSGSDNVKANDTGPLSEQSEPLLTTVQNEKMIYINDRAFPIIEDTLTAREILERTGFAPNEYTLYVVASDENAKTKPLKVKEKLQIKNNMKLNAVLYTTGGQKAR